MARRWFGIDFGTTNSAIAVADEHGVGQVVPIPWQSEFLEVFRSVLFYELEERGSLRRLLTFAGPAAIDAYLQAGGAGGRFIQSIKSYLADVHFSQTSVFGTSRGIEELIGDILLALKQTVEAEIGAIDGPVMVGRPARFVGETAAEALALERLERAYRRAGFETIAFEYEPVAAAFHVESRLNADRLALIGDFGGGTSDFCVLRLGPGARKSADRRADILGVAGIGVAGDMFDARIIEHAVAPGLGRDAVYRGTSGKYLPMPKWIYGEIAHWHRLAFLDRPETRALFREILPSVSEPEQIQGLQALIQGQQGFRLSRAVEAAKIGLTSADETVLAFESGPAAIRRRITYAMLERWIAPELDRIDAVVGDMLNSAGLSEADIDQVYLTGGSSRLRALRKRFEVRFGADKIEDTDALGSVASGLALSARMKG